MRLAKGRNVDTRPPTRAVNAHPVTIVTQTRVLPERAAEFAQWQVRVGDVIASADGFVESELIPPSPPVQLDWVIVQRFASEAAARGWLGSEARSNLIAEVQPWLIGNDDIHVFEDDVSAIASIPISVMISTRVEPGNDERYRAWQHRIAAVQARFPGFQGYRLQPPSPGLHDDWVTILRFDSQANLDTWMSSPDRLRLIAEADEFTGETHVRTMKTGFDAWFPAAEQATSSPPRWKQNMLVLLVLYPVVYLFGRWVGEPLFTDSFDMPFWLALFLSNAASVAILSVLVPRAGARFGWWLGADSQRRDIEGAALLLALYALLLTLFWLY